MIDALAGRLGQARGRRNEILCQRCSSVVRKQALGGLPVGRARQTRGDFHEIAEFLLAKSNEDLKVSLSLFH